VRRAAKPRTPLVARMGLFSNVDGRALLPLFSDSAGRSLVKEETSKRLCPHMHAGGRVPAVCGIIEKRVCSSQAAERRTG